MTGNVKPTNTANQCSPFQIEYWHIDYWAQTEPAQKQSTGELIQGVGYYTHNTN